MKLTRPRAVRTVGPILARAGVVLGASIAVLGLTAAPASAVTGRALPTGSTLYAIGCTSADQLYSVDSFTAEMTEVGTPSDAGGCSGAAAWDAAGGRTYYMHQDGSGSYLDSMDLATGDNVRIGQFTTAAGASTAEPRTIAIAADGHAYAIADRSSGSVLMSLDLSTAVMTPIGPVSGPNAFYAGFSLDPSTGQFYVMTTGGLVSRIDVTNGTLTAVGFLGFGTTRTNSMTIDANGIMWVQNVNSNFESEIWSVVPTAIGSQDVLTGTTVFDTSDPTTAVYTASLLVAPTGGRGTSTAPDTTAGGSTGTTGGTTSTTGPTTAEVTTAAQAPKAALAETGVDETRTDALLGSAGAALALGAGLLVTAAVRRRRNA